MGCNRSEIANKHCDYPDLEVWADTIIYEVLIHNPDSLNEWESRKVKDVKTQKVVDDLFGLVYSGKKKAYNYFTNEELSIDDIKNMERVKFTDRSKFGKLQFTESWTFSADSSRLIKTIHEILLAYEVYNENNELRGYKAVFYIKGF